MLRTALWTLRQPRYAALSALMFVVALGCVAAGTWQISRFEQSVRANDGLKANAHSAAVPLSAVRVPLVGQRPAPHQNDYRFRTVTVSGTYLAGQQFVRDESQDGTSGYYVLTGLRTPAGVLLVVRGFVAADVAANGTSRPPAEVLAPPTGPVTVAGRLESTSGKNDGASELPHDEVESVNPAQQASRRHAAVYDTYLTLLAGQPGTAGVTVLAKPDLSNPAGGAYEAQHFAYIIQWYLFALLALVAPFAIGRSEVREARQRFLGLDPGTEEIDAEPVSERLTRRALSAGGPAEATVAVREPGALARTDGPGPEQWQRALRLARRYGRSLGRGHAGPAELSGPDQTSTGTRAARAAGNGYRLPDVASTNRTSGPHRSPDSFHGSYNDYLWQLALADGAEPPVPAPEPEDPSA